MQVCCNALSIFMWDNLKNNMMLNTNDEVCVDGVVSKEIKNDDPYKLEVVANRDTILLFFISKLYKIDYPTLLFMYEKYDKDIHYIFYLFSGKKISFPTSSKFQSLVYSSDNIIKFLKDGNDNVNLTSDELELAGSLNNIWDLQNEKIVYPIDIIYNIE